MTEKTCDQIYRERTLSPVLKPRKHVYFDTVRLLPRGPHEEMLFNNWMKFPDGQEKERDVDTNMVLSGMIGTPLVFDLVMWSIVFEEFGRADDIRQILSKTSLSLILGSHTRVHSSVGSEFFPGLMLTDGFGREWITAGKPPLRSLKGHYKKTAKLIQGQIKKAAKEGTWTHWYQPIDVKKKARRIESTEWIGVEVRVAPLNLSKPAQFKVGWHGILYSP